MASEDNAIFPTPPREKVIIFANIPAKVECIYVDGITRTKRDILSKHASQVFAASNFEEMIQMSQKAKQSWERMDLFKNVQIIVDISRKPNAQPHGYEITYKVREHKHIVGGISTLVGTNEGSLLFNISSPNMIGRAEKLSSDFTYGTKNSVGFGLTLTKPLQGDPNLMFHVSASQHNADYPWSGYKEAGRGISTGLMCSSALGLHALEWEGVWRELSCLNQATAFSVRQQCGHSIKSSLKHILTRDSRDNKVLPSRGYLLKTVQEVAGLGGDAKFWKVEGEGQFNKELLWDTVFQATFAGGLMKPLQSGAETLIPDRFFLGGPLTLRGFKMKGAGPREDGCSVGADTYWSTGLHLYTPLPFRPGKGGFGDLFRTHFFVNAGNLQNVTFDDAWKDGMKQLATSLRWSCGVGVVLKMGGIARLELNYCWPMKILQGDSINPGLQFGIGMTFL